MSKLKPFHESVVEITESCFSEFYISFGKGLNFLLASSKLLSNLELINKLIKETEIPEKEIARIIEKFQKIAGDFEKSHRSIIPLSMFVDTKEIKERLANIISCLKSKCKKYSSC